MSDYVARLLIAKAFVQGLLPAEGDVSVGRVGPCHGGWDDEIELLCGKARGSIHLWLGEYNENNLRTQVEAYVPLLRARRDNLDADAAAIENTVARFYPAA